MASLSGNEPPDLRDLLAFYAAAGVDDALVDDPIDRFAENAQQRLAASRQQADRAAEAPRPGAAPAAAPPQPRPAAVAAVPDEAQAAAARELASKAATLDELKQIMEGFEGCNLKATAKSMVFADGNPEADLMLVGEAPGRDEDLEGLPFVGRSGQLLDRILAAIGLDRTSAYIANVIPWRPPGNRTPTPHETEICRPFVERQIALARPKVLVTLGGPSAKLLVGSQDGILRLRGSWKNHVTADGTVIPVMPTLHPAYLLRNPAHKKLAWRDFLEVKAKLRQLGSL
ncbi:MULTISPECIES: uracil-DNA glycosylase [Aminobacter]|jgi:uracil-DNA glycosylase family 4|uniref:Type-4 uracil-DNA glycosylase n=1 Tax=Aminobacter aminovorans TaxID=83263 RepID=A0AAC8YS45_AMIAI|nr:MULTISPECIES: uracil-DNA glycosylase [Aminobacter]AMS43580.1 Phage SPO1 DNA polymerase-like protein [Aminobacter aminovorans]MBB3705279.1 DNA polymerase [Aminobacter aminovorans]QOF72778.1 uracil-DNA glycosylase [Aminobacter sp. SR38]